MDERDWRIIKVLYEVKNLTKTAQLLYMSQPALSTRIKQIEKKLGVDIYHHDKRGIDFTDEGIYSYQFAQELLEKLSIFRKNLRNIKTHTASIITLAATPIISKYYLPQLLRRFQKKYSKVVFELQTNNSTKILEMMGKDEVQFGFVRKDSQWDNDRQVLLTTDTACAVASKPFELQNLNSMPRIDYTTEPYFEELVNNWYLETFKSESNIRMHVSSLEICLEMVLNGLGYALLPGIYLEYASNGLCAHPIYYSDGRPVTRSSWLLYQSSVLNNHLANKFLEFIKNEDFESFRTFKK